MNRFAPLALIVLALALVPAAFADNGTPAPVQPTTTAPATTPPTTPPTTAPATTPPTTPPTTRPTTGPAQPNASRPGVQVRLEILRLRLKIVQLRFRLHCGQNGNASQDRCVAFAQKVVAGLTKLDGNVQAKLTALKACTPDSTDPTCKNADKKIAVLTRVDTHLQNVIQKLEAWLNGQSSSSASASSSSSSSSSDSALDQAAASLSQAAAGSNG